MTQGKKAPAGVASSTSKPSTGAVITLLTDFGQRDGFVGIVKGVLLKLAPQARIVDLSHEVAPQDVMEGALILASAVPYFPPRTIHLAVIDPGVGTERRPLLIETDDALLIGPDNGLLSLAAGSQIRRVVHLDRAKYFLAPSSQTFHARDVFAPVAAHCALGIPSTNLGTPVDDWFRLEVPTPRRIEGSIEGRVIHVDRFGNLIGNIRREDLGDFRGEELSISIGGVQISGLSPHYAAVGEGKPVALWNSWGRLEVAVRNKSAARYLRVRNGDRILVRFPGRRG